MRILQLVSALVFSVTSVAFAQGALKALPAPAKKAPAKKGAVTPVTIHRHQVLPAFSKIVISGRPHVLIDQVSELKKPAATIQTQKGAKVSLHVKQKVLYVKTTSPNLHYQPLVHLRVKRLSGLTVNGHASVVVRHVPLDRLRVVANDYAKVELMGLVDVRQIEQHGHSQVRVQWVDSGHLFVQMNNASRLSLAGVAKRLDVNAHDKSHVKAHYLRANTVSIKAASHSVVSVTPLDALSAFATDHATVYYSDYPATLNRETKHSGNVLQLG